jgi:CheY-specific phosphatase CheX
MMEQLETNVVIEMFDMITSTMLGLGSVQDTSDAHDDPLALLDCTAVVGVPGPVPLTIALSSSNQGLRALTCALIAAEPPDVDASMLADTMGELANMLAGQIKSVLNLQQSLGLPKILGEGAFAWSLESDTWHHIPVMTGDVPVLLSISTDAENVRRFR